jgi:hypothetical protein
MSVEKGIEQDATGFTPDEGEPIRIEEEDLKAEESTE